MTTVLHHAGSGAIFSAFEDRTFTNRTLSASPPGAYSFLLRFLRYVYIIVRVDSSRKPESRVFLFPDFLEVSVL